MDWIKANSSNIEGIRYNNRSELLEIEFKSGAIYEYYDVPESLFNEFVGIIRSGGSAGQFFHRNVKGTYRYSRQ